MLSKLIRGEGRLANDMRLPNTTPREKWAERISAAWREQVPSIFETGNLLEAAKAELIANKKHGEWLKMIKEELPFARNTAQRLIVIANNDNLRDGAHAPHLPASWMTLYELTKLTGEQFAAAIKSGAINPKMERKHVAALRGIEPKPRKKKQQLTLSDWRGELTDQLVSAAYDLPATERLELFKSIVHIMDGINRDWASRQEG